MAVRHPRRQGSGTHSPRDSITRKVIMIEIANIKASLKQGSTEESCLKACKREATRLLDIRPQDIARIALHRKSIDARKKSNVHFILCARIELSDRAQELACV